MPKLIGFFFLFDLVLVLLYLINWSLGQPIPFLTRLVDLGGERNLPTWYSSMQLFLVSSMLAIFLFRKFNKNNMESFALLILCLIFAILSLDEIAEIHEWLGARSDVLLPSGSRKNTLFSITGIWMFFIGIPFSVLLISLLAYLKRYLKNKSHITNKYFIGSIIFLGSATGIEIFSNFVSETGITRIIQTSCEELGEMVGVTFILWATYELLVSYNISLDFSACNSTRQLEMSDNPSVEEQSY
jgi:hypothetical protein